MQRSRKFKFDRPMPFTKFHPIVSSNRIHSERRYFLNPISSKR